MSNRLKAWAGITWSAGTPPRDTWLTSDSGDLFCLVSGMTGNWNSGGAIAAFRAASELVTVWDSGPRHDGILSKAATVLDSALSRVHDDLRSASRNHSLMGGAAASLAAVVLADGRALIAHVGDCRVFRWREGTVERLTRDHTLPNTAPPVLTHALGMGDSAFYETQEQILQPADALLLTTGGFPTGSIDLEPLLAPGKESLSERISRMVAAAEAAGPFAPDSHAAILLEFE